MKPLTLGSVQTPHLMLSFATHSSSLYYYNLSCWLGWVLLERGIRKTFFLKTNLKSVFLFLFCKFQ